MKKYQKITIFTLLICSNSFSQNFTINFTSSIGFGKKITGVNTGPSSVVSGTTEECLKEIGTALVRTHDYTGPFDYWGYSNFYNKFNQTFNYSFQSHLPSGYNWSTSDAKISEIVNANLQPFFRLGISDEPGTTSPPATPMPKDEDQYNFHTFAGIAKRTAMHYTASFDNGFNYDIPYWEIWNEPNNNGFWQIDSVNAYYRLYQQCVDSLKSFNPQLKVGGPAAAKNAFYTGGIHYTINQDYVSNFLNFCQSNSVPLDFYSFHMYDRTNPYSLRMLTDTLAYFLNQYGFDSTEIIVSETNINTGGYNNTSKGCSYLTSQLISTVNSRLSKFIWYRGVDLNPLCNSDIGTTASLTLNGYAYKFFNELNELTPILLSSTGNQYSTANIRDSLNNLMILSGKNSTNDLVKLLVSNHESMHDSLNINIQNLPWSSTDEIKITIEQIKSDAYSSSNYTTVGGTSLNITLDSVSDASVYFITIKNESLLSDQSINNEKGNLKIFPNPAENTIHFSKEVENVQIYDVLGQLILTQNEPTNQILLNNFKEGLYYIKLNDLTIKFVVKH
ncbi:MAG: T9SS type A sorting domain-containing protein [Flavobacteriia bacterium]|nr:T9SS type A sorting domain-containing protein [Flavobacteriia bacterium]